MIPTIAGIVGLLLGFLVSPNPIVAIVCGAMMALIAFAMTGFKVKGTEPITHDNLNREENVLPSRNSKFAIDDHGEATSREFGAMFVQQSFATSEGLLEMMFAAGKPGQNLPIRLAVMSDPLAARLFFTAMLIAGYFVYPVKHLKVDEETKTEIMEGAIGELVTLRRPDGTLVGREDIEAVRGLIVSFYDFLVTDIEKRTAHKNEEPTPHTAPPKSTELLLSILVSHYNGGGSASQAAVSKLKQEGFYAPKYAAVTRFIDDAAHIPYESLRRLNTRWLRSI